MKIYKVILVTFLYLLQSTCSINIFPIICDESMERIVYDNKNATYIPKDAFRNCTNVKEIRLTNSKLKKIRYEALRNLPKLSKMILSFNELYTLPLDLCQLKPMKYLDLHYNEFKVFPSIQCQELTTLKIKMNQLKEIKFPSNTELSSLNILDLSFNQIDTINRSDFIYFENRSLQSLKLEVNNISKISQGAFHYIRKHLQHLDLSFNERLGSKDFGNILASFDHVRHRKKWHLELYLSKCSITNLKLSMFKPVKHIYFTRLFLSDNQIDHIEQGFGNIQLKYLHLDGNKLAYIQENQFIQVKGLHTLNLDNNLIQTIHRKAFNGLISLKYLYLKGNRLVNLELLMTKSLKSLEGLYVDKNGFNSWTLCGEKSEEAADNICISRSLCQSKIKGDIKHSFKIDIYLPVCFHISDNTSVIIKHPALTMQPKVYKHWHMLLLLIPAMILLICLFIKRRHLKSCLKRNNSTPRHCRSPKNEKLSDNNIYESLSEIKFNAYDKVTNGHNISERKV